MNSRNYHLPDEYPLEKFTNEEFYYIISSLLGLGDPGFVPERLYLSFDQDSLDAPADIKFLFLTRNLIQSDTGEKEVTEYTLGKIDSGFDDIMLFRWQCNPERMSPEKPDIDVAQIRSTFYELNSPISFHPVSLLKRINKIVCSDEFVKRNDNSLFDLKWHVHVPEGIRHKFGFGEIGKSGINFSGTYFLIVEPDRTNTDRVIVNSFQLNECAPEEGEIAQLSQWFIDSASIQLYENGWADSVLNYALAQDLKRMSESIHLPPHMRHEAFKTNKIEILAETIISLINQLPKQKREELLKDESIADWVKYAQVTYIEEFNLHVDGLGLMGADEIAWREALGDLIETDEGNFNWKDNVIVYEQLYETSSKISARYSTLAYTFSKHLDADRWKERGADWNYYWINLKDLFLPSEEAAEREIARLNKAYHELVGIEDIMYQRNSTDLKIIR